LDHICISFDGGKTTMNFIEAALLIQGSACVYSKKVEYLYSLVYQALDFISNKRREKQPSSIGQDGQDADASFGPEHEEPFLSLDDLRDASQASVDMRRDQQPQTVDIVPLTPMALVPAEEAEKRNNPLLSRKGEILASRKDFRMNTCTPHASGAFMLELAGLSPTRFSQERHPDRAAAAQRSAPGDGSARGPVSACEGPVPVLDFSEDGDNNAADGSRARRGGPTFADLELLYWQQLKLRFAAQRKLQHRKDERAAFDIHRYGDELAAALGALGEWRPFSSLVAGRAPFDVCRYMLAALQLANDRTVEVAREPPLAVDTMRLRLLTRERAHERFRGAARPTDPVPPQ
ncbi:condensin-2 complex subunit H2, partial [Nothoprocta perdicaria]|uniref:condensin-2 complex subunit H2 n=1 Tax=Nothoprocta perdicaria TaxID=30464 RepID=UPI000E1BDB64